MSNRNSFHEDSKPSLLLIVVGFLFFLVGLFYLFTLPLSFFYGQMTMHSSSSWGPVPIIFITLLGWVLFAYGILRYFKWKESNLLCRLANKMQFTKYWEPHSKIFLIISMILFISITTIYIIVSPKDPLDEFNAELEKMNREAQEMISE